MALSKFQQDMGYLHWQERAACAGADPSVFFPMDSEPEASEEALSYCRQCPVREECLKYALKHNVEFGVWGGMTEQERRALRKKTA